jgi:hypothetical protein
MYYGIKAEAKKKNQMTKPILSKKSNARDITIPDLILHYKAIIVKQHGFGRKTDMKMNALQ